MMASLVSLLLPLAGAHKHPTWADFGPVEWVTIVVGGSLAMWTVWKAVMYTVRPGEEDPHHIKRSILNDDLLQARIPKRRLQREKAEAEGSA